MHSNRVIRQLNEVVYEQSPESPVPPALQPSSSPSNNLREVASNALSNYLLTGALVHHQDHVFGNPSNVIVSNNPSNKDELDRPTTLALIGSGGGQQSQLHSTNSAFHYNAASPYASSAYSEPSTPASSLASSNILHVSGYANAYAGISPTLEFGIFWNPPWPFTAAAASHSLSTGTAAIGQSEMLNPGDLPSSLVEVAASHYHNQTQFLSPSSGITPNQFPLPSCRGQSTVLLPSPASLMPRNQGLRTTPVSTRRGGRRPREVEDDNHSLLTEEDKDKRDKRRQRNKEAAARCRKRRLDQMATLQKQVDDLREGSRQQQMQIEQLTMEKDHIENILSQHSNCKLSKSNDTNSSAHLILGYPSNSMQQNRLGAVQMLPSFKRNPSPALAEQCLNASRGHNILEPTYFKEEFMDSSPSSQYTNNNSHSMMIMDNDNDPVISDAAVGNKSRSKQDDRGLRECSELSTDQYDAYGNQISHDGHERPKTLFDNATMRGNPTFEPNVISTPSNGLLDTPCYSSFLLESRTGLTPMISGPIPITNGPMHVNNTPNMPPHNGDLRDL